MVNGHQSAVGKRETDHRPPAADRRFAPLTLNYFNYFTEIEETFIRRRGKNLLLSPLDWALIESWQDRGVPLHIVLRGIEKVFDGVEKQPSRHRSVKSLFYCKEEIEAQYALWLDSQVGRNGVQTSEMQDQTPEPEHHRTAKNELFADEAIKNHLEKVSTDLKNVYQNQTNEMKEIVERVLKRLAELEKNYHSAETLEDSLEQLESLIDECLLKNFETGELKSEVEKQLASYRPKMEQEVFQRTFDLMLLKRLREEAGIPRLSLFYL